MSQTYQVTGINLKGMPLGERDRLLTILTPEHGIIQAVAGGARKYQSSLRGRSELFVVNQLLLVKGRSSLHRLTQAETLYTYPKLSQNLGKLAISQYLTEIVLCFALSEQPQYELYTLFREHLQRIENCILCPDSPPTSLLPLLNQGIIHLLSLAGIAPQVPPLSPHEMEGCKGGSLSVEPNHSRVGFSYQAGGVISPDKEAINHLLSYRELTLLQELSKPYLSSDFSGEVAHLQTLEKLLRNYTEYHFHRPIRSASLVDTLFRETVP